MIVMKYRTEFTAKGKVALITESTETYCPERDNCLRTTQDCVGLLNDCFRLAWQMEEVVYLLTLDCRCRLFGVCEVSHGMVSESPLSPTRGLYEGAAARGLTHCRRAQPPLRRSFPLLWMICILCIGCGTRENFWEWVWKISLLIGRKKILQHERWDYD